jgi:hypothetical protein
VLRGDLDERPYCLIRRCSRAACILPQRLAPVASAAAPLASRPLPLPHDLASGAFDTSNRPLFDPPEARLKGRDALRPDASRPPRRAGAVKG